MKEMRKVFGKFLILSILSVFFFVFSNMSEAGTNWTDWDGWPGFTKDDKERLIPTEAGIFPFIRKGDVNLAYEENKGVLGSPIYTSGTDKVFDRAVVLSLLNKSKYQLWQGTIKRYTYDRGSGNLSSNSDFNLVTLMETAAQNGEHQRQFYYWLGNFNAKYNKLALEFDSDGPWDNAGKKSAFSDGTKSIIDTQSSSAVGLAEALGLNSRLVSNTSDTHPSRMMMAWLMGLVYQRDGDNKWSIQWSKYSRTPTPDMSQGSMMYVESPTTGLYVSDDAKPMWLQSMSTYLKNRPPVLFMHSNEGLLHGIYMEGGDKKYKSYGSPSITMPSWKHNTVEFFAFTPPNAMQGLRLVGQKFNISVDATAAKKRTVGQILDNYIIPNPPTGGLSDRDNGANNMTNYAIAGYVTDGPVVVRDMAINPAFDGYRQSDDGRFPAKDEHKWRTSVFGLMGRGGAGLYSLSFQKLGDDDFAFNWAVENDLYRYDPRSTNANDKKGAVVLWSSMKNSSGTNDAVGSGKRIDYPLNGSDDGDYNYSRLGWNAPRPAFGIMKLKRDAGSTNAANVMVLAAGQHYISNTEYNSTYDTTVIKDNGNIGAAVYVSNPVNGKILYRATANTTIGNADGNPVSMTESDAKPQMGMMVTPVATTVVGKHLAAKAKSEKTDQDPAFLRSAFTADNRGNIFELSFVSEDKKGDWKPLAGFDNIETRRVASLRSSSASDTDNNIIPYMLAVAQDIRNGQIDEGTDLWICGGTADKSTVAVDKVAYPLRNKKQYIFGFNRIPHGKKMSELSILDKGVELDALNKIGYATYDGDFKAWYIELGKDSTESAGEYVSAPPTMYMGQLYVATYLPKEKAARVYILDPTNGKSYLGHKGGSKFAQIADININGLSAVRIGTDNANKAVIKMIASYTHEEGSSAPALNTGDNEGLGADSLAHNDEFGALTFDTFVNGGTSGTGELEADTDYIYYWRRYNE